jgi:hypothetical protein
MGRGKYFAIEVGTMTLNLTCHRMLFDLSLSDSSTMKYSHIEHSIACHTYVQRKYVRVPGNLYFILM